MITTETYAIFALIRRKFRSQYIISNLVTEDPKWRFTHQFFADLVASNPYAKNNASGLSETLCQKLKNIFRHPRIYWIKLTRRLPPNCKNRNKRQAKRKPDFKMIGAGEDVFVVWNGQIQAYYEIDDPQFPDNIKLTRNQMHAGSVNLYD